MMFEIINNQCLFAGCLTAACALLAYSFKAISAENIGPVKTQIDPPIPPQGPGLDMYIITYLNFPYIRICIYNFYLE